ncbi:P-loop containing nucleoside triphosphate hydrolase protein, partial [Hygrophoropsis aurantiaca]
GVGKTALVSQFCYSEFPLEEYEPTAFETVPPKHVMIGDTYYNVEVIDEFFTGEIDSTPSDSIIRWQREIIRRSEVFLILYSITSLSSFEKVTTIHQQIFADKDPALCPAIIVGTKFDCYEDREVTAEDGRNLAKTLGCDFIETSSKNDVNVENAFMIPLTALVNQSSATQQSQTKNKRKRRVACTII